MIATMRRTATATALLVALAGGGCKKKDEEKKPAEPAAAAAQEPGARTGKTGDKELRDPSRKAAMAARSGNAERVASLRMLPISVDEVKSAVPTLPGSKPLGPPTLAMGGRQVRSNLCVTGKTTDEVAADLERAFREQGFTDVRTKPHPRDAAVVLISAEKLPLRAGGSIQRGDFAGCEQATGGTKVSLSYFKRNPDGAGDPMESSAADPTQ